MGRSLGYLFPETLGKTFKGKRTFPLAGEGAHVRDQEPLVSLQGVMPPVYDQGQLGSCVAQALAGAVEYLLPRTGAAAERPSRLALYWQARQRIGRTTQDSGAILGDGVSVLRGRGWAPEELWPYNVERFVDTPPAELDRAGEKRRLVNSEPLDWDLDTLQWELATGSVVVAGIRVYEAFERVGSDGVIPPPGGKCLGGHAVLLCGYDAPAGMVCLRNSWGEGWGKGGYGWIPQEYLLDPTECGELWSLRSVRVLPSLGG